jgi:hypothetical protein
MSTSPEPSSTDPTGTESSGTESSGTESSGTESSGTESSGTESSGTESSSTHPIGPEPVDAERIVDETSATQALHERISPTSALAIEPDEVQDSTSAHGPVATPTGATAAVPAVSPAAPVGATLVEFRPVPAEPLPEPSPEPSPDPSSRSGWAARGVRMRTVVLGLVLLAVGVTSLVRVLTDVRIDDSLVLLTLLVVAGALLLGGGIASAVREARAGRSRT